MCVFGSVGIAASGVALAGGATGLEMITAGLGSPAFTAVVEFPDPGGLAGGSLDSVLPALSSAFHGRRRMMRTAAARRSENSKERIFIAILGGTIGSPRRCAPSNRSVRPGRRDWNDSG